MDIPNYLQISKTIASSGQPNESDIALIKSLGYELVVNLAMSSSDNALENEDGVVTDLGMTYVHLPIEWDSPKVEQFDTFAAIMQQHSETSVWVHCALNMRVSAFLYLYSVKFLGVSPEQGQEKLLKIWQPNEIWQRFIDNVSRRA